MDVQGGPGGQRLEGWGMLVSVRWRVIFCPLQQAPPQGLGSGRSVPSATLPTPKTATAASGTAVDTSRNTDPACSTLLPHLPPPSPPTSSPPPILTSPPQPPPIHLIPRCYLATYSPPIPTCPLHACTPAGAWAAPAAVPVPVPRQPTPISGPLPRTRQPRHLTALQPGPASYQPPTPGFFTPGCFTPGLFAPCAPSRQLPGAP